MRIFSAWSLAALACAAPAPTAGVTPVEVAAPVTVEDAGPGLRDVRARPPDERARQEAACFAVPWQAKSAALGPKPLTSETRERLDVLERECRDIRPHDGPGRFVTPLSIPPVECHYGIARIYFQYAHYPESARWFLRVTKEHGEEDIAVFAAQLHLDSLNVLATHAEPSRPECRELLGQDAQRFACRWCGKPDIGDACEIFRRVAKELRTDGEGCPVE